MYLKVFSDLKTYKLGFINALFEGMGDVYPYLKIIFIWMNAKCNTVFKCKHDYRFF